MNTDESSWDPLYRSWSSIMILLSCLILFLTILYLSDYSTPHKYILILIILINIIFIIYFIRKDLYGRHGVSRKFEIREQTDVYRIISTIEKSFSDYSRRNNTLYQKISFLTHGSPYHLESKELEHQGQIFFHFLQEYDRNSIIIFLFHDARTLWNDIDRIIEGQQQ